MSYCTICSVKSLKNNTVLFEERYKYNVNAKNQHYSKNYCQSESLFYEKLAK